MTTERLKDDLLRLGVTEDIVLVVHTSLKNVGRTVDGPEGVIQALQEVIGLSGTLVMPSMTDRRDPYDLKQTPTSEMGIVAETFWRMPGVLRTMHPTSAFAARGPLAGEITAEHPLENPEGINSPIGKVYQFDGRILLVGVGHDANTTIHLGESLSNVPYRRIKTLRLLENGQVMTRKIPFIDHCCQNFRKLGPVLRERGLVRTGLVGQAKAWLMRSRRVVEITCELLKSDPNLFLCPPEAQCSQCDEARDYAILRSEI